MSILTVDIMSVFCFFNFAFTLSNVLFCFFPIHCHDKVLGFLFFRLVGSCAADDREWHRGQ